MRLNLYDILRVMKQFFEKIIKSKALWLSLIIILQTVVYTWAGMSKAYFHMDEIYSYSLSNAEHVQIFENEDFYDNWHTPAYYNDFVTVNEDERWNLAPVYVNQKNDVHPPLFYLLLRLGMEMTPGHFTKWTGIILNMLVAAVNTVLVYVIVERLLRKEKSAQVKSLILTAVVALSLATVSTVVYIRMYELLTMWILLTTYLHLKLLDSKKIEPKLLVAIAVTALLGVLTQYYYIFYIVAMFVVFTVRYLRAGRKKEWQAYFGALAVAGGVSLLIWPFTIVHMFFSNRGGGVLLALIQPLVLLDNLWKYITVINRYAFHLLFAVAVLALIFLGGYALLKQKKLQIDEKEQSVMAVILIPTLFYLLIVATVSPFTELRYIAPVCGLLVILMIYMLYKLLGIYWSAKKCNIAMGIVLVLSAVVMPVTAQIEPDTIYRERGEVLAKVKEYKEVPALYMTNGSGDWNFLNDLLIFRELDESYIVKDLQGNETQRDERIQRILKGKDLSKGLLVFVTDDYDKGGMMKSIEHATNMYDVEHLARMVTSDIYYIKALEDER